jgi:hypothetical protein
MSAGITIEGLSNKQMALADIMWAISTREGVESFISTLPKADQRDCRTIIELMQLAFADEVDSVDEATKLLSKYNKQ